MTWTYNASPDSSSTGGRRDAVRLLLKDTNTSSQLYQDEELAFFLTENGNNVWRAAADAAEGLSAREAESKSVGDLSISGFGKTWGALAKSYRMRADSQATPFAGGISITSKEGYDADTDRVTPSFTRNTMGYPGSTMQST